MVSEWMAAIPWWGWVCIAVISVGLVFSASCRIWAAFHRSILLDRARAHATRGVRIGDGDKDAIHVHARPWGVVVHVPLGWMTDAEAASFAGDIARTWHRQVRSVRPRRCIWGGWVSDMWSIRL